MNKCATLGIRALRKEKTWLQDPERFTINRKLVKVLTPGVFYKYLGVQCGAGGAVPHRIVEELTSKLDRLQSAPAKPQQKLWALKAVVLPELQYPLVNVVCSLGQLGKCDRLIRHFLRKALHLPKDTSSGFFFAHQVDGCLSVVCLETRIPRLRKDLVQRLRVSPDAAVRLAASAEGMRNENTPRERQLQERQHWSSKL